MTVTAPYASELAGEELTIDLTAPVAVVEPARVRDPLVPFLVVGTIMLIALLVLAFALSAGA